MVGNSKWDFYFIETKAHSYFATRNKISQTTNDKSFLSDISKLYPHAIPPHANTASLPSSDFVISSVIIVSKKVNL